MVAGVQQNHYQLLSILRKCDLRMHATETSLQIEQQNHINYISVNHVDFSAESFNIFKQHQIINNLKIFLH